MKEFINGLTGTRMLVADDREKEYLAAGHKLVSVKEQENDAPHAHTGGQTTESEETSGAAEGAKQAAPAAGAATKTQPAAQKKASTTQKRKPAAKK